MKIEIVVSMEVLQQNQSVGQASKMSGNKWWVTNKNLFIALHLLTKYLGRYYFCFCWWGTKMKKDKIVNCKNGNCHENPLTAGIEWFDSLDKYWSSDEYTSRAHYSALTNVMPFLFLEQKLDGMMPWYLLLLYSIFTMSQLTWFCLMASPFTLHHQWSTELGNYRTYWTEPVR